MIGLIDERPVVRMRSTDTMEKVTRRHPELLRPHQATLFQKLYLATEQEVRCT
ncbi:hypothetical protein [Exiguobacterium sp. s142]|uniref:hypothetical protein n=1 Tax=Exiguobacterium sp. s142 TaxID=2751222 RepID=UPI001BEBBD81|nr:hypothetical protein [Exiguobacterium sp. s142]